MMPALEDDVRPGLAADTVLEVGLDDRDAVVAGVWLAEELAESFAGVKAA